MDITAIARQGAAIGFQIASGILKSGSLRDISGGTYDPATDTRTGGSTDYSVSGLFYQSREQKLAMDAARTGMILLQVADVEASGFPVPPDQADKWVMDGIVWTIDRVDADPSNTVYMLAIRR